MERFTAMSTFNDGVFKTRLGFRILMGEPIKKEDINIGDICHALSRKPVFNGHSIIEWSYACRTLHFIEKAGQLADNEKFTRDEMLTLCLRYAYLAYGIDKKEITSEFITALQDCFKFTYTYSVRVNELVSVVIKNEQSQLLYDTVTCRLPNYASPVIACTKLQREISKIFSQIT